MLSYRFKIYPARKLALFVLSGEITASNGRDILIEYMDDPFFDPTATMVTDARVITAINSNYDDIFKTVSGIRNTLKKFDRGAVSIVWVGGDMAYGMARVVETVVGMFSEIAVKIVRTEPELLQYLDVQDVTRLKDYAEQCDNKTA